mmetsp:Transcript_44358/g.71845  ORF Transcript_44358/g.71845 Transcript_44358/m.71845 type:complete len:226 (+) Transcript_44358:134-811(+)
MANPANIEQARMRGMFTSLQQQDPEITNIIAYSKFAVAYLLKQDGQSPGWRKANIEGPVYLVRRRSAPRFNLLVKNQFNTIDLIDSLHPDWELDCQKNYVFYKVEDPHQQIRGLWFHEDSERLKIQASLEATMTEIRNGKPPNENQGRKMPLNDGPPPLPSMADTSQIDTLYAQFGLQRPGDQETSQDSVTVTKASLSTALHALADDDNFLRMVMQKLKDAPADS